MRIHSSLILLFAASLAAAFSRAPAQGLPIGQWRSHYPYNVSESIATDGQTIFSAAGLGFLTLDVATGEIQAYSKVSGLGDVRTTRVAHDVSTGTTVIAYENSNIDLFRSGAFTPIPDLKLKTATGSKRIFDIRAEGGKAWLSTGLGIVVLDLEKGEVEETYTFGAGGTSIAVQAFQRVGESFYAATGQGLYRAPRTSPRLTDFSTWQRVGGASAFTGMAALGDTLYVQSDSGVLRLRTDTVGGQYFDTVFRSRFVAHIDAGRGGLLISEFGGPRSGVKKLSAGGALADSFSVPAPAGALELADGSQWAADRYGGIARREGSGFRNLAAPGPQYFTSYDILPVNGEVIVTHGGFSDAYVQRGYLFGASMLKEGVWTIYSSYNYAPFGGSVTDITPVAKGPDGTIYLGSLGDGLQILKPDGSYERLREGSVVENAFNTGAGQDSAYNVLSLAFDNDGNLVVGQFAGQAHDFLVRTPEGQWYRYTTPVSSTPDFRNSAAGITIDDANQRWYFFPQGGGLMCYNDGGTPEAPGDDAYRYFVAGEGAGGLPSSAVLSLVKDRDGAIWVGTAEGIGIISCASTAIQDRTICEAERPVVQYDQFAGYLFEGEAVRTMAVDGANRKWIGTTNGVWLISPTGDSVVLRFTAENSPLPSNVIQKIAVDGVTGDVYIGTDAGLLSYRGTATDGVETNEGLVTYPNPVPSGYRGSIAVRGLVDGADVRITDIAGQLVFRTKALGGQAVWNGTDYTGKRPASGVYLVFVTNTDGTQTATGKIVFME